MRNKQGLFPVWPDWDAVFGVIFRIFFVVEKYRIIFAAKFCYPMYLLYALLAVFPTAEAPDTVKTYDIETVVVSASVKHNERYAEEPLAVSAFPAARLERERVGEIKDLSLAVPNFVQADYGSKMTGSIYLRGIGARMEQPAVGLYVDNIPILNKNNYDTDLYDLRRADVLRGPQGTLYGRNTIGGVIDLHTLSPFDYRGTRFRAGYGNGNTSEVRVSTYHRPTDNFGFSIALNHRYSDGFFTNEYDGTSADRILSEGGRIKTVFRLDPRWTLEHTLMAGYVEQKGFAYALYDEATGTVSPIDHNDPCSYERLNITDGLTFRYDGPRLRFSSTTSYQFTDDDMRMDQDYRPLSMFTLRQTQKEHAATQEFVLRPHASAQWQWITGLFGFYRRNRMEAPVEFRRDGIDRLILTPANNGIHHIFPHADLLIEDEFPIENLFTLPAWGASLYHQSSWRAGRWRLAAGLRADYERTAVEYDNDALLRYMFTLNMTEYKDFSVAMNGEKKKSFFEWMPHVSAVYDLPAGTLYASVSRGYKSGGYNTQIFSAILQEKMQSDLMAEVMASLGRPGTGESGYDVSEAIYYKPEYSWNYEVGAHLAWFDGRLNLDAALFYIDLRDQQLTVFPPGQTTGRMMSNAGRSRSFGAELSLAYRYGRFALTADYGYTDAKFIEYSTADRENPGEEIDYKGLYVPYAPRHTVSAGIEYRQPIAGRWADALTLHAGWQGMGRIYWNETNTASQPFYGQLQASATLHMGRFSASVWGRNLTGTDFNTFYFRSLENSFVQRGKPLRYGLTLSLTL